MPTFVTMKPLTDTDYIHALIAEGEHQQQDFKFEISDVRKIAKTLSAFANTDGGRLLIGVKDNGKIAGVRSAEEQYMIEAAAQLYCVPPVNCHWQTFLAEGRTVLVVTVDESASKPVYAKDENGRRLAYLRIADELYLKRLIVGGFEGVYEFSKNFRNEGMDRTHNPEFTCMEIYVSYKDYQWMMNILQKLNQIAQISKILWENLVQEQVLRLIS